MLNIIRKMEGIVIEMVGEVMVMFLVGLRYIYLGLGIILVIGSLYLSKIMPTDALIITFSFYL